MGGGGRRASPFFGVETGAFVGTHPECTAEAPALVPSGSPGRSSPRHTQSCLHTLAHVCVHTQGGGRRLRALRQRRLGYRCPTVWGGG